MAQEDDDLADQAQRMLDAMNEFLSNGTILGALSADDLSSLKGDRDDLEKMLRYYRAVSFFTKKRGRRPVAAQAGPRRGMSVSGIVGVMSAPSVAIGAGTAAGEGAGAALGAVLIEIILPIGAALAAAAALSAMTGGSLKDSAARKLGEIANDLFRDLTDLDALSTALAITAEVAATLTLEDLFKAIAKAVRAWRAVPLGILLAELALRFPQCAAAIKVFTSAAKRLIQVKYSGIPISGSGFLQLVAAYTAAEVDLQACVNQALEKGIPAKKP